MKRLLVTVSLAMSIPFIGASQGTLIGSSTRNGSFESGVSAPWLGDVVATQNPSFASQGGWYGVLQSSPPGASREIAFQFLTASPNDGRTFIATFDARAGAIGFDSLSVDFFSRSGDGVFIGANEVPLVFPVLSSSEWRTYQVQYQLPASWSGDGEVSLQILFSRSDAVSGTTYVGYLDSVTLQQVPEPSITALLGLAGLLAICRLCVRERWPNPAHALDGGIPSRFHVLRRSPASSDVHCSAVAASSHAPRPHLTHVAFLTHLTPLPPMRRLPLFVIFATFRG